MSGLPPALAPWAAPLAHLSPALQPALGELARRLAAAVGPQGGLHVDAGEPDGVAGLSRRGPYERLLLSEWLLASELPDEFLRRASTGEHLFLERSRRDRTAGRRVVALLDAGPEQLGAPRLVHLALLVVLEARAEAAGATLEWSTAQGPFDGRARGLSRGGVRRLLDARSPQPAGGSAVEAWREALAAEEGPQPERWLVGGPGLLALARPGDATVLVEEEVDPAARRLRVVVTRRGRGARELLLDPPAEAEGVRLLRDPFAEATAPVGRLPARLLADAGVLLHPGGGRLLARLATGELVDVPVPSSPRQATGAPRTARARGRAVTAGWLRRGVITVGRQEHWTWVGGAHFTCVEEGGHLPTPAAEHQPLGTMVVPGKGPDALFLDATGTLFHAAFGAEDRTPARSLHRVAGQVAVLAWLSGGASYVERLASGSLQLVTWANPGKHPAARWAAELGPGTGRAFLAAQALARWVATENGAGGLWTVHQVGARPDAVETAWSLRPPDGTEVVGVTCLKGRPGLVILERDRRSLTLLWRGGLTPLHKAGAEVARASLSLDGRVLAYTTRAGGLVAWSARRDVILLQLASPEAP